tara:strand:- start:68 stop:604 length:537 start_codon:yes stop_codon:yes gene_type:complete
MENIMSEVIGQKHTKHCIVCDVELTNKNWYPSRVKKKEYNCIPCHNLKRLKAKAKEKNFPPNLMARIIGMKVYKDYEKIKEGQVYIMCNPSFRNWCKVGMAVDAEDRLKQYQTSSPHRDYELVKCYNTSNRRETETKAHAELEKHYKRKGEWFMCTGYNAQKILDAMLETEGEQLGLF